MIQFMNVCKSYNGKAALNDISFELAEGEMAFLTGHSGAGKTTLLKLILLIEQASRGQVIINNQSVSRLAKKHVAQLRRDIGMIFQNPQLLPRHTVFENVALPLIIAGYRRAEIQKRVRAALDKVNLLEKEALFPQVLSTGEQQRVGIARAVVNKPSILLADEPTGNLDPALSMEIIRLLEAFNAVGVTVLIATHDLALIAPMNHRFMILKQGQLIGAAPHDKKKGQLKGAALHDK
jgi:cell division transport system ATP-binding protein